MCLQERERKKEWVRGEGKDKVGQKNRGIRESETKERLRGRERRRECLRERE